MSSSKQEAALARKALEAGSLDHAASHAATAIALDPQDADALALIDRLVAMPARGFGAALARMFGGGSDPAPLFASDGFAGNVAARARAHWIRGRLDHAFPLAVDLAAQVSDRPFVQWALDIAREAASRRVELDPGPYLTAYAALGIGTMGLVRLRPTEQRFFTPWAELGETLIAASPAGPKTPLVRMATSALLRRAGRYEDALAVLVPLEVESNASFLTTRGLAQRALGMRDQAIDSFARAIRAPNGHPDFAFEIARVLWDEGRFADARDQLAHTPSEGAEESIAVEWLDERLGRAPRRVWTRVIGENAEYDALRRLAMGELVAPRMADASTNAIASLEDAPPLVLRLQTSALEAPSALVAVALRTLGVPDARTLEYAASAVPTPHPFEPLDRTLGFALWERARDALPVQSIAAPSERVSQLVDGIVKSLWARPDESGSPWLGLGEAWRIARACPELDELEPRELVAAMIHPTAPESWRDTVAWVFDRQVVAALLLAAQDLHRPWLTSRRRRSLMGLVFGPADWTRAAALVALREAVLDEPDALDDARVWCARVLEAAPDRGHVPWAEALRSMYLVPGMPERDIARIAGLQSSDEVADHANARGGAR